ncbi:MAG: hypothetical protein AAF633_05830, partial [Chloroflexota bacterium]
LEVIDPDGSHGGFWGRFIRWYQRLGGPEARMLEQVELALKNNEFAIRVDIDDSDEKRDSVSAAMEDHTNRTIFYILGGTISVLKMGENYYDPEKNYPAE